MLIAGGFLVVLSGASFVALILALLSMRDSAELARHSTAELADAAEVEKLLIDMESGLRGYVITRDNGFLEPWTTGRRKFLQQALALAHHADSPAERARMLRIVSDGRSYIEGYGIPLIQAVRRGDPAAGVGSPLGALAVAEQGKIRVDSLRQQLDRFLASERTAVDARRTTANADFRRAVVFASTSVALSLALIVLFAGYLARIVVRPVTRAAAMVGRLAAGDLTTRMPETGVAEVGVLERSLNTMADSLETSQTAEKRLLNRQSALQRVASLVAEERSPEEIFAAVAEEVGRLLQIDRAFVSRYEIDDSVTILAGWTASGEALPVHIRFPIKEYSISNLVRTTGQAVRIDAYPDGGASPVGNRSAVGAPITVEGRLWGLVTVGSSSGEPSPPDTEERLTAFTELVATAIANAHAREEIAASRARIVAAADETRRRIERDLHDGAQQRLVALALDLRAIEAGAAPELRAKVAKVVGELDGVTHDLREMSRGIHPAILSEGGLRPALRTLARRSAVPVEFEAETEQRFSEPVEVATYYVVSEALTNTARHAQASRVTVAVETPDSVLRVAVQDDGDGGADPARGSGLTGLRDRVEALGGRIEIASPRGAGTSIVVEFPLSS